MVSRKDFLFLKLNEKKEKLLKDDYVKNTINKIAITNDINQESEKVKELFIYEYNIKLFSSIEGNISLCDLIDNNELDDRFIYLFPIEFQAKHEIIKNKVIEYISKIENSYTDTCKVNIEYISEIENLYTNTCKVNKETPSEFENKTLTFREELIDYTSKNDSPFNVVQVLDVSRELLNKETPLQLLKLLFMFATFLIDCIKKIIKYSSNFFNKSYPKKMDFDKTEHERTQKYNSAH